MYKRQALQLAVSFQALYFLLHIPLLLYCSAPRWCTCLMHFGFLCYMCILVSLGESQRKLKHQSDLIYIGWQPGSWRVFFCRLRRAVESYQHCRSQMKYSTLLALHSKLAHLTPSSIRDAGLVALHRPGHRTSFYSFRTKASGLSYLGSYRTPVGSNRTHLSTS